MNSLHCLVGKASAGGVSCKRTGAGGPAHGEQGGVLMDEEGRVEEKVGVA